MFIGMRKLKTLNVTMLVVPFTTYCDDHLLRITLFYVVSLPRKALLTFLYKSHQTYCLEILPRNRVSMHIPRRTKLWASITRRSYSKP